MTGALHDRIPEIALGWIDAGKSAALATVIETWGSAPRPVGAQLAISSDAELQGSDSGGCVESAVVAEALDALEDGAPRLLEYGISDDDAFAVGLACGGTIRIMVEPIGKGQGPDEALIRELEYLKELTSQSLTSLDSKYSSVTLKEYMESISLLELRFAQCLSLVDEARGMGLGNRSLDTPS